MSDVQTADCGFAAQTIRSAAAAAVAVAVRNLWDLQWPPKTASARHFTGNAKRKREEKEETASFVHCQPPPTEADDRASRRCDGSHCDKLCMNNTVLYSTLVHGNEEDEAAEAVMRRLRLSFAGKRKAAFCQQAKVIQSSLAVVVAEPSHDLEWAACYRHESNTVEESEAELLDSNKMLSAVARRSRAEGVGIGWCAARREGGSAKYFYWTRFRLCLFPFDLSLPPQKAAS